MPETLQLLAVPGLPELRPGDDLAGLLAAAAPWLADGDVVVVTSKAVSKVEGRLLRTPTDPAGREAARSAAVDAETVRVVATVEGTRIVETRLGLVQAAAGVDASNVRPDEIALLPLDPDASARGLRTALAALLGVEVAVVVTDTMGRAWRHGLIDAAIGVAGMAAIRDHRGTVDVHGNVLGLTEMADADAVAAAAELVKGKHAGVPVAVLRGLVVQDDPAGSAPLRRSAATDLFRYGSRDVVATRRSVRAFDPRPVPAAVLDRALRAALTAPAPHHTHPVRFVHVTDRGRRTALLSAMSAAWAADLRRDGRTEAQIRRRLARGDLLGQAPTLVVPILVRAGAHDYPDARRRAAEERMFLVAAGAAVENLLVALAAEDVGSCWVSSTLFCADVVQAQLDLPPDWEPIGAVAVGYPAVGPGPRPQLDLDDYVVRR